MLTPPSSENAVLFQSHLSPSPASHPNEPLWEHSNLYCPFVYTSESPSLFIHAGIYNQKGDGRRGGDKTEKKELKGNQGKFYWET